MLEHFDGGDWPTARRLWEEWIVTVDDPSEALEAFGHFNTMQRAWLKYEDRIYLRDENLWVKK